MPVTNTLKLVITQIFFLAMKDMSRCLLSMCSSVGMIQEHTLTL